MPNLKDLFRFYGKSVEIQFNSYSLFVDSFFNTKEEFTLILDFQESYQHEEMSSLPSRIELM